MVDKAVSNIIGRRHSLQRRHNQLIKFKGYYGGGINLLAAGATLDDLLSICLRAAEER